MSFSTDFLELMPSTVKVSTRSAHSNYGEPTFTGSTTSYRARIVEKTGFVRTADGEEVGYSTVLWVRSTGAVSINTSDRITLPSGIGPSSRPPIMAVEVLPDEDGEHHRKIYCGH